MTRVEYAKRIETREQWNDISVEAQRDLAAKQGPRPWRAADRAPVFHHERYALALNRLIFFVEEPIPTRHIEGGVCDRWAPSRPRPVLCRQGVTGTRRHGKRGR
jgi:hypothetical protein